LVKEGLSVTKLIGETISIGATMLQKGDIISFTLVLSKHKLYWSKQFKLLEYFKKIKDFIGMSEKEYSIGNEKRITMKNKAEDISNKCAQTKEDENRVYYKRFRPAFNHYNILGELSLMRRYPDVLYHWLKDDAEFKKDNIHAASI